MCKPNGATPERRSKQTRIPPLPSRPHSCGRRSWPNSHEVIGTVGAGGPRTTPARGVADDTLANPTENTHTRTHTRNQITLLLLSGWNYLFNIEGWKFAQWVYFIHSDTLFKIFLLWWHIQTWMTILTSLLNRRFRRVLLDIGIRIADRSRLYLIENN